MPPGVLINLLRLLALANNAANAALADGHDELVDGGIVRQRKNIDRLNLAGVGVVKLLGDLDCADVAADGGAHVGVLKRHRNFLLLKFRH